MNIHIGNKTWLFATNNYEHVFPSKDRNRQTDRYTNKNTTCSKVPSLKVYVTTSSSENSWLTRTARPAMGTTRNSTRNESWLWSYVARNFEYMRYIVAHDDTMKNIFMAELYSDTNDVNRSR